MQKTFVSSMVFILVFSFLVVSSFFSNEFLVIVFQGVPMLFSKVFSATFFFGLLPFCERKSRLDAHKSSQELITPASGSQSLIETLRRRCWALKQTCDVSNASFSVFSTILCPPPIWNLTYGLEPHCGGSSGPPAGLQSLSETLRRRC